MQDLAQTFTLAQLILRRLEPAITVTKQAIDRDDETTMDHGSGTAAIGDDDIGQNLLDLFQDLERPPGENLGNEGNLFWTDCSVNMANEGMRLDATNSYPITGISNQFDWYTSAPLL
jgi:hypothetical protein